jgi:glycosyltransferase involved in cell wall biosynthesis
VIYVGQVSLSKGLPFLIQAVRGLPLDLSIIGNVFDRRVVQDLPDNVEVLGALAPEALARRYWEATAFVLPTLHDAYGLVVLEALAAGLPVITTTAAGAAQLLDDRHMIVEPGSAKELRSALLSLTRLSAEERLTIAESANAIELPDGSFMKCDWDSYAAQVMTHVSQALAETAGRA